MWCQLPCSAAKVAKETVYGSTGKQVVAVNMVQDKFPRNQHRNQLSPRRAQGPWQPYMYITRLISPKAHAHGTLWQDGPQCQGLSTQGIYLPLLPEDRLTSVSMLAEKEGQPSCKGYHQTEALVSQDDQLSPSTPARHSDQCLALQFRSGHWCG